MDDCNLTMVLLDTLSAMSSRTSTLYENEQLEDASAIISEWTTDTHACVLTHYLQSNLPLIDDVMIYISVENDELQECRFSFDPNVLLETNDEID